LFNNKASYNKKLVISIITLFILLISLLFNGIHFFYKPNKFSFITNGFNFKDKNLIDVPVYFINSGSRNNFILNVELLFSDNSEFTSNHWIKPIKTFNGEVKPGEIIKFVYSIDNKYHKDLFLLVHGEDYLDKDVYVGIKIINMDYNKKQYCNFRLLGRIKLLKEGGSHHGPEAPFREYIINLLKNDNSKKCKDFQIHL